ncbi:MAG: hypothetical protein E7279_03680 [Lachnospiraceae bacterium]|nr:hypothetical protein [Lachnospiraceae bacterium]
MYQRWLMSIMLYEHNRIAYESALSMLDEVGKAAIIHPTGTGKSFIGFKLCEDHLDKRILWLSPSSYIFETQVENLKAESDTTCNNITFITYAKLMNMSVNELEDIQPDYIILDEFHRCGAAEWGNGVDRLVEMYSEVPILGLSATAIRYLDNQRNMAEELFDSYIASEMTLGEAIVRGILNPPKYVLSIFSYKDELSRYEKRIRLAKNKAVRDKAEDYLERLRRTLDKAEGLDEIFSKHITDRTGKYIIFCANFEAMKEAMDKTHEWFRLVDEKPYIYHVYSDDASTSAEFKEFKDNEDDSHMRLLFCIDALNEGVHVEDVSGVILLRPTVSPIIYKQQIGRALSASRKKKPVVFDIVNNVENLYSIDAVREEMEVAMQYMRHEDASDLIVNDTFTIIDEVRECVALFEALEDTLSASWDVMYKEAKNYYSEHGNLLIPAAYVTPEGLGLGRWIRTQRLSRQQGAMSPDRIKKLDAIHMVWTAVLKNKWYRNYELAKAFYEEHGNLIIPYNYVTHVIDSHNNKVTVKLGIWISSQRDSYAKGKLSEEKKDMLSRIGMSWDRFDEKWEMGFHCAKKYYEENGDINFVPKELEVDGFNLNKWLHTQRDRNNKGKLSEERKSRLDALGFKWSVHEAFWERGYENAVSYKKAHGNLKLPTGYECEDGFKLKSWLSNQQTRYRKGTLTDVQIEKLMGIGCIN